MKKTTKRYFQRSKWFDIWVMSNWRDLIPQHSTSIIFICKCCPHRTDEHDMNCIECCPVSRAMDLAKGRTWATQYLVGHLHLSATSAAPREKGF